jgi:hypothetical protein
MSFKIQQLMIQLKKPKDHFSDSEDKAERKHAKPQNATITKFGALCKGIKPIRQYHQCNEVLQSPEM